ncbi:hypothetical protein [Mycolicibacter senuensis]|uniref:hypothetical protein n=1 Tax=Mycolicibacter senuensis TaxID=386913 RepID=UPI001FD2AA37|nr:hypothetical protein [Mycolicibacter senuensis]
MAFPTASANQGSTTAAASGAVTEVTPIAHSAAHSRSTSRRTTSWSMADGVNVK